MNSCLARSIAIASTVSTCSQPP
ncbi:hypothetical protein V12B01_13735 [Vibrio splendidus 12B01]|nr:hypothetical protein V12B01_13735 [Vibrio splendidus 12B01]EAQ55085.1 hypothetical protein MED222_05705 [Vibrio sp. MED222]